MAARRKTTRGKKTTTTKRRTPSKLVKPTKPKMSDSPQKWEKFDRDMQKYKEGKAKIKRIANKYKPKNND